MKKTIIIIVYDFCALKFSYTELNLSVLFESLLWCLKSATNI